MEILKQQYGPPLQTKETGSVKLIDFGMAYFT